MHWLKTRPPQESPTAATLGISPYMLRIKIELVPAGIVERSRLVADLAVWNVSNLAEDSEYRYALFLCHHDDRFARPPRRGAAGDDDFDAEPDDEEDDGAAERVAARLGHEGPPWAQGRVAHRRAEPWSTLVAAVLAEVHRGE